jgi:hypothetical protein
MAGDSSVEVPESKGKTEIHLRGAKVYGVLSQLPSCGSYLGNSGWRSNRFSTACIAAFPSEMPFW